MWGALELVECPPAPSGRHPFIRAVHEDVPRNNALERKDTFTGRTGILGWLPTPRHDQLARDKRCALQRYTATRNQVDRVLLAVGSSVWNCEIRPAEFFVVDPNVFSHSSVVHYCNNGTFVYWELVGKGNKCLLKDGDEIVPYMRQIEPPLGSTLRSAVKVQHGQTIMHRISITEGYLGEAVTDCIIDDFEATLQGLPVGCIMVSVQAQLTSVKAEAAKRDEVQNLLVFANELVPQFPQIWTSTDNMLTSGDQVLLVELNKGNREFKPLSIRWIPRTYSSCLASKGCNIQGTTGETRACSNSMEVPEKECGTVPTCQWSRGSLSGASTAAFTTSACTAKGNQRSPTKMGTSGPKGPKRAYVSPGAGGVLFLRSVEVGKVPPIPGTEDMRDPGVHQAGCITAEGSEGMLAVFKEFQATREYLISIGPRAA